MTYRVVITAAAKQNLRAAFLWVSERAPLTAAQWLGRFEIELESLANFPERCALAHENALVEPEIRQLIFGKRQSAYRALFTIVAGEVRVLHIRRAVRDWAEAADLTGE